MYNSPEFDRLSFYGTAAAQDEHMATVYNLSNFVVNFFNIERIAKEKVNFFTPAQRAHFLNTYYISEVNNIMHRFVKIDEDVKAVLAPLMPGDPERAVREVRLAEKVKAEKEKQAYYKSENLTGGRKPWKIDLLNEEKYNADNAALNQKYEAAKANKKTEENKKAEEGKALPQKIAPVAPAASERKKYIWN
jgi:predicted YcjX-like family ATPase